MCTHVYVHLHVSVLCVFLHVRICACVSGHVCVNINVCCVFVHACVCVHGEGGWSLSRLCLSAPPLDGVLQCLQIPSEANKSQMVFLWSSSLEANCGSLSLHLQSKESTCFVAIRLY